MAVRVLFRRLLSRTVLRRAFLLLAVVAVVLALRAEGSALRTSLVRTGVPAVLASCAATFAGLLASALCWRSLLAGLGTELSPRLALHVFFLGQLGKYLPGNVFAVAAQAELARDHGVARSRIVTAGLVFLGVLTVTGLLVAVVLLPIASPDVLRRYAWVLLALPVGLLALVPQVLNRLVATALKATRRPPLEQPLSARHLAAATGWALLMWAFYGLHLLPLVLAQPHDRAANVVLVATGGYALAWTAGFLFVVAPAGAGIREAVLVLALAGIADRPAALAVALLSRGIQTLGDVVWAVVGAALRQKPVAPVGTSTG
ncbi:MAG: hypothetical protein JWM02_2132 [Frankiales bacterium]|nr:hypothetical protein [Frankiales bacterium]